MWKFEPPGGLHGNDRHTQSGRGGGRQLTLRDQHVGALTAGEHRSTHPIITAGDSSDVLVDI